MVDSVFQQIALLLLLSAVVGAVALRLRQPLIVAFIVVGIGIGPQGFGAIEGHQEIALLAEIGIALLLFVVGLKLDLHLIRTVGPVALVAGLGQVIFTSVVGYVIALALGLDPLGAIYVAVALTFSSTIIIVKLLSDKREIGETHGKIALGILIVQDIAVVIVMIALTAFGDQAEGRGLAAEFGIVALRGVLFLGAIAALMKWVLPALLHRLAAERELLILFAIAWAVALAAGGDLLGFSEEVGAFLAGVSLASTGYREAIGGRLITVRDFLLLFFFIDLGLQLDFGDAQAQMGRAAVLSLFVLIGNPLIVMTIMGLMGYRKRTSFLTGLTVAQISEFSLIFVALGLSLGHIGSQEVGLVTMVGIVTIGLSTYLILYSKQIFGRVSPLLGVFERSRPRKEGLEAASSIDPPKYIVFGLGRFGGNIFADLLAEGTPSLGVDSEPSKIRLWTSRGADVVYGDAGDPEMPEHIPLDRAEWVICAVPDVGANLTVARAFREAGFRGGIALTAHLEGDEAILRGVDADHILMPFRDAAEDALGRLRSSRSA